MQEGQAGGNVQQAAVHLGLQRYTLCTFGDVIRQSRCMAALAALWCTEAAPAAMLVDWPCQKVQAVSSPC